MLLLTTSKSLFALYQKKKVSVCLHLPWPPCTHDNFISSHKGCFQSYKHIHGPSWHSLNFSFLWWVWPTCRYPNPLWSCSQQIHLSKSISARYTFPCYFFDGQHSTPYNKGSPTIIFQMFVIKVALNNHIILWSLFLVWSPFNNPTLHFVLLLLPSYGPWIIVYLSISIHKGYNLGTTSTWILVMYSFSDASP